MSLDTITGDYYLLDKQIYKCSECNYLFDTSTYQLYEVLRTERGVLVFYEDHMERLHEGLNRLGYEGLYRSSHFKNELLVFLKANSNRIGNVKILCARRGNELNIAAYYIPHKYPDEKIYSEGIDLMTFSIERADPQIKQIHVSNLVKQNIERILMENNAYEILLIDHENNIREGSKSNFFLIRNNCLYSAPNDKILAGITRKKLLSIVEKESIEVVYRDIALSDISYYEAAFICGTSPKVLPVKKINDLIFNTKNSMVTLIKDKYNAMIEQYIEENISK